MRVGDYVRFNGEIAKIRNIKRYKTKEDIYVFDRILDLNEDRACNDNTIYNSQWKYFDNVKSSPNIIDLIERFDLVNGHLVICKMYEDEKDIPTIIKCVGDYYFKEEDIKSIVTHEQIESMEYKICTK